MKTIIVIGVAFVIGLFANNQSMNKCVERGNSVETCLMVMKP